MTVLTPGSTLITDVADAIMVQLAALSVDGTPVNTYVTEPGYEGMDIPAATLFLPDMERPAISESEASLGTDGWDYTWTLRLYTGLDDARTAQRQLQVLLADTILAIDNDHTLGGVVDDSEITRATSGVVHTQNRSFPLMAYECELHVRRRVDTLYH